MPYPNEHACRLVEPDDCMEGDENWGRVTRKSASHGGRAYDVIRGRLKSSGEWVDQAYRYPRATWPASEAQAHCKAHHGILFEPAEGTDEKGTAGFGGCGHEAPAQAPSAAPPLSGAEGVREDAETWNLRCAAQHFGPWCIEPAWFERTVAAVKAGLWPARAVPRASDGGDEHEEPARRMAYRRFSDGIAFIAIEGPMMKGESKYGGTSTVRIRQALRQAVRDEAVKGILILGDSPGGTVAGTEELADEVARAAEAKPVHVHIESLGASAFVWVASQAARISATPLSLVGSIGTYTVVEDSSGQLAKEGIVVHIISTGPYKGAFEPGTPVKPEHLEYVQGYVNGMNEHFLAGVASGRGMDLEAVRRLADGRVHLAADAMALGLLDAVETQDDALKALRAAVAARAAPGPGPDAIGTAGVAADDPRPAGAQAKPPAKPASDENAAGEGAGAALSVSDRAGIEANLRAALKRFTDAFGPQGALWFADGKTFEGCLALEADRLKADREVLADKLAAAEAARALDRGSPTPVSFTPAEGVGGGRPGLASKIGTNLARVAAGIVFAKTE